MSRTSTKPRTTTRRGFKSSESVSPDVKPYKEVPVGGEKNGGTRLVPITRASRYYPADDVVLPKKSKKITPPASLRPSITPGTILILLAGRFRGKRVVFLKQLESGLLLITGPYKINGVPLRRVNQAYVIATSTKVSLPSRIADDISDAFFAKDAKAKESPESEFFKEGKSKAKAPYPEGKATEQKQVDKVVVDAVTKQRNLGKYLKSSWGLTKGQFPHQIVF